MSVGFYSVCKIEKMALSGEIFQNKEKKRYKRKPENATYKMRKPIEMEANTNLFTNSNYRIKDGIKGD
ncbi:3021_t:CDS:2 [Entrophospora sp. SA101]|nr:3021_t:CDS:2 [Entrophospora sp. SA101]